MDKLTFALATPDDERGLRALLARNAMPGRVRLRFEREPDYFAGAAAMGPFTQVLVARDGDDVVGLACRAVRTMYINGAPEDVGYLGQLRVDARYRGRMLVQRGFRLLRELHDDGRVRGYVTTIVDGNAEAERVLVARRRSVMPRYRFHDRLITFALRVPRRDASLRVDDVNVDDVLAFLAREGPRRNFFPVRDHLPDATTPGFDARDLIVVRRDGAIAGVAGLWNQHAFKQTVVDGYDRALAAARPFYNCIAKIAGNVTLPRPGVALRSGYGSFFCVANDDARVAREVIEALLHRAAAHRLDLLLLGFSERDPLLAVARTIRHDEYRSGIYTVTWNDGDDFHDRLDLRPAALELGTL